MGFICSVNDGPFTDKNLFWFWFIVRSLFLFNCIYDRTGYQCLYHRAYYLLHHKYQNKLVCFMEVYRLQIIWKNLVHQLLKLVHHYTYSHYNQLVGSHNYYMNKRWMLGDISYMSRWRFCVDCIFLMDYMITKLFHGHNLCNYFLTLNTNYILNDFLIMGECNCL